MRTFTALALALTCLGCPGKSKNKPPTAGDGAGAADPCAALASKVEALYRAEGAGARPATDAGAQLADELVAANVHMVLKDCRTDPGTFVPCLSKAQSTAEIESECVVPLDDEGKVEGRAFGSKR